MLICVNIGVLKTAFNFDCESNGSQFLKDCYEVQAEAERRSITFAQGLAQDTQHVCSHNVFFEGFEMNLFLESEKWARQ